MNFHMTPLDDDRQRETLNGQTTISMSQKDLDIYQNKLTWDFILGVSSG